MRVHTDTHNTHTCTHAHMHIYTEKERVGWSCCGGDSSIHQTEVFLKVAETIGLGRDQEEAPGSRENAGDGG